MKSIFLLSLALLTSSALSNPGLDERQASTTATSSSSTTTTPLPTPLSPSQFSVAALQLIPQYIPQSLLPGLGVAVQAAASSASMTGDINSIVTSALIAATPPAFLSAIPTQYQPIISSLEMAVSSLRAIGQGEVPGQAKVTTETTNGLVETTTIPGMLTQTRSNGSLFTSTLPLTGPGAVVVLTMTNSAGSTFYTGSTLTSTTPTPTSTPTGTPAPSTASAASVASTSTKKGAAVPTQVPVAVAGIVGFVGFLAAL
ncbi:hypothetical protein MMC08_005757 [Hypocenomyce scalaris]|nr:hypothetical protein [Hypocenomyce scalaris]